MKHVAALSLPIHPAATSCGNAGGRVPGAPVTYAGNARSPGPVCRVVVLDVVGVGCSYGNVLRVSRRRGVRARVCVCAWGGGGGHREMYSACTWDILNQYILKPCTFY